MTTNNTASIDLAQLDSLEALARAADPTGAMHLVTHYRNDADLKAEEAWRAAANPATVQQLIALARRSLTSGSPAAVGDLSGASLDDVVDNLREYASNAGYSHNDYADMMRQAANTIESLRAMIWNYSAPVHDAAAPTLPPVVCVGRPSTTTDKATIFFARDVTDDELLEVNEVLRSRLNRPAAGAAAKTDHAPTIGGMRVVIDPTMAPDAIRIVNPASAAGAGSDQAPLPDMTEGELNCLAALERNLDAAPDDAAWAIAKLLRRLRAAASTSVTVQDERALFEANYRQRHEIEGKPLSACLTTDRAKEAWESWQARAALAHPVQDGEKDARVVQDEPAPQHEKMATNNVAWSHELQLRLMSADDYGDDELHNLLGEAACLLASLTGRPGATQPKEPPHA